MTIKQICNCKKFVEKYFFAVNHTKPLYLKPGHLYRVVDVGLRLLSLIILDFQFILFVLFLVCLLLLALLLHHVLFLLPLTAFCCTIYTVTVNLQFSVNNVNKLKRIFYYFWHALSRWYVFTKKNMKFNAFEFYSSSCSVHVIMTSPKMTYRVFAVDWHLIEPLQYKEKQNNCWKNGNNRFGTLEA